MPIKPENKNKYPKNWKAISEHIRFVRAKNRCEVCGVPNYAVGYREKGEFVPTCGNRLHDEAGRGEFSYAEAVDMAKFCNDEKIQEGKKYIVIVLTVAHLDHIPENCDPSNLLAMCQSCHNKYDRNHRNQTKKNKLNQLNIF